MHQVCATVLAQRPAGKTQALARAISSCSLGSPACHPPPPQSLEPELRTTTQASAQKVLAALDLLWKSDHPLLLPLLGRRDQHWPLAPCKAGPGATLVLGPHPREAACILRGREPRTLCPDVQPRATLWPPSPLGTAGCWTPSSLVMCASVVGRTKPYSQLCPLAQVCDWSTCSCGLAPDPPGPCFLFGFCRLVFLTMEKKIIVVSDTERLPYPSEREKP